MMVDVLGVGILEPRNVIEKMPFMTVECADDDCLCEVAYDASAGAAADADAPVPAPTSDDDEFGTRW